MRRVLRIASRVVTVVFLMTIASSGAVFAKGPTQAVIEGPGLTHAIALRAPSSRAIGPTLAALMGDSRFFDGLGCRRCPPRMREPPAVVLGPRYAVRYTMASEGQPSSEIVQHVYPFADPRPVAYMPPGQPYWSPDTETRGGWFVARPRLKRLLVEIGLPPVAPRPRPATSVPSIATSRATWVLPSAIVGAALVAVAVTLVVRRRGHRASVTETA